MALKDRNRFRKTYGVIRVPPVYEEEGGVTVLRLGSLETIELQFNNTKKSIALCSLLYTTPVVIVTPTDNVNTYVSRVFEHNGVTAIEIMSSDVFTGTVFIGVGESST